MRVRAGSEARRLPYTCLLRHTYEGNNTPEAVDLCECLDGWLGLTEVSGRSKVSPGVRTDRKVVDSAKVDRKSRTV